MKEERQVLKEIPLCEVIRDVYTFSLKCSVYAALKVHGQSNPIISKN